MIESSYKDMGKEYEFQTFIRKYAPKNSKKFVAGQSHIPVTKQQITIGDKMNMIEAVLKGWLTEGEYADRFAKQLSQVAEKRFVTLANSGSSANLLAMLAMAESNRAVGSRDVITCATGFPTTVNAIIQAGFFPRFVDANSLTLNASEWQVLEMIKSPEVAGVMLAHTLGFPFREDLIAEECRKHGKFFVVDCCDALGSEINGHPVGYYADIHTYSFYPAHHISTAEGGAVVTHDPKLDRLIKSYRDWGRDCWCGTGVDNTCGLRFTQQFGELPFGYDHKYVYSRIGYNLKMTDLQASLGESQIHRLKDFTQARRMNTMKLREGLRDLNHRIFFPEYPAETNPSPFGFPITFLAGETKKRNDLVTFLTKRNIGTRPVFAGNLTRQPAYIDAGFVFDDFPLDDADYITNHTFWIGCHPSLTDEMITYMIESVQDFFKEAS
jgi:CDP-6-deoxy-D-xylo-4-hexulose-3-dehydrase